MSLVRVKKVRPTQKKRKPCGCGKKKSRARSANVGMSTIHGQNGSVKRKLFL